MPEGKERKAEQRGSVRESCTAPHSGCVPSVAFGNTLRKTPRTQWEPGGKAALCASLWKESIEMVALDLAW